jgi:hypothetical protein
MKCDLRALSRFRGALLTSAFLFATGLVQVLMAQELHMIKGPVDVDEKTSAVEDISGQSSFLDDLLAHGSPLHFGLTVGETYDDNIFISPVKTADFITHLSPAVDFEKGDRTSTHTPYLNAYFASTLFFYAQNPAQNRQDYNADVYYQYQWTRLTLGIDQNYQHLTDPSIDIGNFADRDIYTTAVNGSYVYNDKLSLFATGTQRITSYLSGSSVNTNEWDADAYALYQVTPKLSLGGGPQISFIDISGAPNESHEDLLLHARYNPGGKITAELTAGAEYLQYQDNLNPGHVLPIFNLTGDYTPWDGTTFSISASRQTAVSYDVTGETYVNTSVQAGVRQEVFQDVFFTATASYTMTNYEFGSEQVQGPRRKDNYYAVSVGVEWSPKEWLKAGANYQRSQDDSNFAQNTFNDNQINMQTGVSF